MKILAFSDLHEEEAAFEALKELAPEYDHVFICGDISRNVSFAGDVIKAFPNSFIVPGNWDSERVGDLLAESSQWLHGKRAELEGGLNAVGFGYSCPTPFHTFGERNDADMYSGLSKLRIDSNTLLLLHCPPKGHFDIGMLGRRIGSDSILKVINERQPLAAFFGHAHEVMGTSKLGNTTLVKLPPANSMRACSLAIRDKKITVEFITLR